MLDWLRQLFSSRPAPLAHLWVVSAPSGAGKTSLVRELCRRQPQLVMSCSYTTREQRPGEQHGVDYFFLERAEFERMAANGEFLEYAEVFGNFYATGRDHVRQLLDAGRNVILEIDWQGARQVRSAMPTARTVFILPPSYAELERRLRGRASDSEAVIQRRLSEACSDMGHWDEFDYVVINDDFEAAADRLEAILSERDVGCRTSDPQVRDRVQGVLATTRPA